MAGEKTVHRRGAGKSTPMVASLKKRALEIFREQGTVLAACKAVKRDRKQWQRWVKDDPDFAKAVEIAREDYTDSLEAVADDRAKEKSDTLLIFRLKALRPDIYRETVQYQVRGEIDHHHTLELKLASMVPPDVALALQDPNTFRDLIDKATAKSIPVGSGSTVEEK